MRVIFTKIFHTNVIEKIDYWNRKYCVINSKSITGRKTNFNVKTYNLRQTYFVKMTYNLERKNIIILKLCVIHKYTI